MSSILVNTTVPTAFKDAGVAPVLAEKAAADLKQTISASAVGIKVDAQVLDVVAGAKAKFENASPRELQQYLNTSQFSEADSEVMMNVFLATVAQREQDDPKGSKSDPATALLSFDPSAWEKHVGVLIAAVVAVNIARQASAQMSGTFAQLAFESAVAQGVAIVKGGEAAMYSAVMGAVVAGAMSVGGAALSLKGQAQKHTDIKTNQMDARRFDASAAAARQDLKAFSQTKMPSGPKTATGVNSKGEATVLKAQKDADHLVDGEKAALESVMKNAMDSAKDARMQSKLAQKTIDGNMTVGNAVTSMATVLSNGLSSIIRLSEVANREKEVLRQAEQGINRSVSEMATQNVSDDNSMLLKLLEAFQQMLEGRNATNSTIATARA